MKVTDLINKAAIRAGIVAHDESISDSEAKDAFENLNSVLAEITLQPLLTPSFKYPVTLTGVTGADGVKDEYLIDKLAIRMASVWGVNPPAAVIQSANNLERMIKRENVRPIRHNYEPDYWID